MTTKVTSDNFLYQYYNDVTTRLNQIKTVVEDGTSENDDLKKDLSIRIQDYINQNTRNEDEIAYPAKHYSILNIEGSHIGKLLNSVFRFVFRSIGHRDRETIQKNDLLKFMQHMDLSSSKGLMQGITFTNFPEELKRDLKKLNARYMAIERLRSEIRKTESEKSAVGVVLNGLAEHCNLSEMPQIKIEIQLGDGELFYYQFTNAFKSHANYGEGVVIGSVTGRDDEYNIPFLGYRIDGTPYQSKGEISYQFAFHFPNNEWAVLGTRGPLFELEGTYEMFPASEVAAINLTNVFAINARRFHLVTQETQTSK